MECACDKTLPVPEDLRDPASFDTEFLGIGGAMSGGLSTARSGRAGYSSIVRSTEPASLSAMRSCPSKALSTDGWEARSELLSTLASAPLFGSADLPAAPEVLRT